MPEMPFSFFWGMSSVTYRCFAIMSWASDTDDHRVIS